MKVNNHGVGILEAVMAIGVLTIAGIACINLTSTVIKSTKALELRTMWRTFGLRIEYVLKENLICDSSSLVNPNVSAGRLVTSTIGVDQNLDRFDLFIEKWNAASAIQIAKVWAPGDPVDDFKITKIYARQVSDVTADKPSSGVGRLVLFNFNVEGRPFNDELAVRTFKYRYGFAVEVDGTGAAVSCFGQNSWRRICKQLGFTYAPLALGVNKKICD